MGGSVGKQPDGSVLSATAEILVVLCSECDRSVFV